MHNSWDTLVIFLAVLFTIILLSLVAYYFYNLNVAKYTKSRTERSKKIECAKLKREIQWRNNTDFMWANFERIKTILTFFFLFFLFFILLTLVTTSTLGKVLSILFVILLLVSFAFYGFYIYKSYKEFEDKAKARLDDFEKKIKEGIEKEISFDGDNIQHFSNEDDEFDTTPKTISFPIEVTKIAFPPLEKNATKHKIISTRKLEFLILSREYFSICKGATTFNLLEPSIDPKKCIEKSGSSGECDEYYYSQMQNVIYDGKAIIIKYNKDTGHEDVSFVCKKGPDQKNAMKALKEKLRLTERQKLQKIQEHKDYEMIKEKRIQEKKKISEEKEHKEE